MSLFGTILTIVVLIAIAIAIMLFERQRAERIERDTRAWRRDRTRKRHANRDAS